MIDFDEVMKVKTLYELDEKFTSRIYGYKNADAYYDDACSSRFINDIQIPTLILNAHDDPFVCPSTLTHENKNILMVVTDRGGHLGFSEGFFPSGLSNWTVDVVGEYLDALNGMKRK
jgi:predicted alpha/beta-fold hydrolase